MRYAGQTKEIFFDYINNFLTVARCAEHYGVSVHSMNRLIRYWRANAWAE